MDIQSMRIVSISINVVCLLFCILISFIYLIKKKIETKENSIYNFLLFFNFMSLVSELIFYLTAFHNQSFFVLCLQKLYFASTAIWSFIYMIYIIVITSKKNYILSENIDFGTKKTGVFISMAIIFLLIFITPIENVYENGYLVSSVGISTAITFILSFIFILIDIILVIKFRKNVQKHKVISLFLFLFLIMLEFLASVFGIQLLLITFPMTLVCFLMYHTIENPDAQTINELYKNKMLVEKSFEEKSNFLFKMTQEVKKPINNMKGIITSLKSSDDISELKQGVKLLDANSKQMDFIVNDVLDITTLDAKNIKIVNNRYNVYNLFKDIEKRMQEYAKEEVEFRFNIDENIPYLYGDSIKLKQIIMSILLNSIKKTKSGFIELSIDAIVKYDVCRLIIEVEDSGVGMSIDKVNDILVTTSELSVDDINNLEKLDINLKLCQKSIKLLGGNLMIRSEEDKGTEVIITIDQQIYENKHSVSELDKYENILYNSSRILLVSDNEEDLSLIKKIINNDNVLISSSFYGNDAIQKIEAGKSYDLIIIDDEMSNMSGLTTMQELKKIDAFKIPVVVMLDNSKERIKEHYIKDGFDDYILRENMNEEIKRIFDKYC